MVLAKEISNAYTPQQMMDEYSNYYEHFDSDSPLEARTFLREKLIESIYDKLESQETVTILDMGGGRQIFEQETATDNKFKTIKNQVTWISIDISSIPRNKMLATATAEPIQANGAKLPFASKSFDIVFSSMAIDFMPRSSFEEVKRVLKVEGDFLVNFHHPNLISIAQLALPTVLRKLQSARKSYQHKVDHGSSKVSKAKEKLNKIEIEFKDIQFILNSFSAHVFYNLDQIFDLLNSVFNNSNIELNEFENTAGRNGWFFAQVLLNS